MSTLADYQQRFMAALRTNAGALESMRGADAPAPGAGGRSGPATRAAERSRLPAMPGFAVYRNSVMKACVDALEANFPAVTRLVGSEWMRAAAAAYAQEELPCGPMLLDYGATFPAFLAAFAPASDLLWLPAVATLDRLWIESHMAADAQPLDAACLAAIEPSRLLDVRLQPHPAARWTACKRSPAYTIWSRNRTETADGPEIEWLPEGALLTRPQEVVLHRLLRPAGLAFMDACTAGHTLCEATLAALDAEPEADLPALVRLLLDAGAFTAVVSPETVHQPAGAAPARIATKPPASAASSSIHASIPVSIPTPSRGAPDGTHRPYRNARPARQTAGAAQPFRRPPRPVVRP